MTSHQKYDDDDDEGCMLTPWMSCGHLLLLLLLLGYKKTDTPPSLLT
jgi:hypothetical protein